MNQTTTKLKRQWNSSKLEESCAVWQYSFETYKQTLSFDREGYYSELTEEVKSNTASFGPGARLIHSYPIISEQDAAAVSLHADVVATAPDMTWGEKMKS